MSLNQETVREMGIWVIRIALVIGAILGGFYHQEDLIYGCIGGLIASFVILD